MQITQSALVTGASRGIGRSIALDLAQQGYCVGLLARTLEDLNSLAEEIEQLGSQAIIVPADVRDASAVHHAVKTFIKKAGKIDLLVNNAGILKEGCSNISPEDFADLIQTNLVGAVSVIQAVLPSMKEADSGAIINLISRSGKAAYPQVGGYSASKFGFYGYNEALFKELADTGIRVSAICPSFTNTEMAQGLKDLSPEEMIQPEDVVKTLRYLLSLSKGASIKEITLTCQKHVARTLEA